MVEKNKQKARSKKETNHLKTYKNPIVKCLKRLLYYKPKTFFGVTIGSAVLTAIATAYVQMFFDFNLPFSKHLKRNDKLVCVEKDKKTHKEDNKQMVDLKKLTEFLQIWGGILSENMSTTNNMLLLNCPTCTESIRITAPVNKGVTVMCNACQTQLFTQMRLKQNVHD